MKSTSTARFKFLSLYVGFSFVFLNHPGLCMKWYTSAQYEQVFKVKAEDVAIRVEGAKIIDKTEFGEPLDVWKFKQPGVWVDDTIEHGIQGSYNNKLYYQVQGIGIVENPRSDINLVSEFLHRQGYPGDKPGPSDEGLEPEPSPAEAVDPEPNARLWPLQFNN